MLTINNLSREFGSTTVLDDVSATFNAGQVHVVIGANGAGKSTLFRCLLGLDDHKGHIQWRGRPLRAADGVIAAVFDRTPFYPRLTGRQNLRVLAPDADDGPHQYLATSLLGARVATYSHGQRKRLALMMVFNSPAEILVLDEPSLGLDAGGMREMVADLQRMAGERTVIVADHHVEWYRGVAHTATVVSQGGARQVDLDPGRGGEELVELRDASAPPVAR